MLKVIKQFPGPSVDNPALLRQFAQTLAARYREMFPPLRGFALEVEDKTTKRSYGWEIRILRGNLGGMKLGLSPALGARQRIEVTLGKTSRLEMLLFKIAVGTAMALMLPFMIAGLFKARLGFVLLVGAPIYFALALFLAAIATLMARLFSLLDHNFDDGDRRRVLALAGEVPLPTTLQRLPVQETKAPDPAATMPANPKRSGPWPLGSRTFD